MLSACAAKPEQVAPRQVKVDATNVVDVQKAGYTIQNKDGQKLYCRRDIVTGSHVQHKTTCLTEAEMIEMQNRTQAGMEAFQRQPQTKMGQ
jgi:hypothetical protein